MSEWLLFPLISRGFRQESRLHGTFTSLKSQDCPDQKPGNRLMTKGDNRGIGPRIQDLTINLQLTREES